MKKIQSETDKQYRHGSIEPHVIVTLLLSASHFSFLLHFGAMFGLVSGWTTVRNLKVLQHFFRVSK